MKYALLAASLIAVTASTANADSVATGTVSATVVSDLSIVAQKPLGFGYVVAGANGGTVTVSVGDDRSTTGTVQATEEFGRAIFRIMGGADRAYFIQTPPDQTFYSSGTSNLPDHTTNSETNVNGEIRTLTVGNFNFYSVTADSTSSGKLNGSGEDLVYVGGTLTVPQNAEAGHYTGFVPINVSY